MVSTVWDLAGVRGGMMWHSLEPSQHLGRADEIGLSAEKPGCSDRFKCVPPPHCRGNGCFASAGIAHKGKLDLADQIRTAPSHAKNTGGMPQR